MANEDKNEGLTPEERTAIEVMLTAPGEFTLCLLAAKAGTIDRRKLAKQNATADFMAEYERLEMGGMDDRRTAQAWLIGFRMAPPKKSNDEGQ